MHKLEKTIANKIYPFHIQLVNFFFFKAYTNECECQTCQIYIYAVAVS